MNSLRHFAGTTVAILLHHSALGRIALLRTFWRIFLKHKLLVGILKRRITEERIFSHTIYVGDYAAFVIVFEEVFVTGVYYFESRDPSPKVIDGGANIGVSLAYFKTIYPRCRITAFEPNERNFALLAKTVERNRWTDVTLHNVGLHRTDGDLLFYDFNELEGSLSSGFWHPSAAGEPRRVLKVHTVPVSRFVNGRLDLLKLDVEGSEQAILDDLAESGKLKRIRRIILEYHHHVQPDEDELGRFLLLLEKSGFGYHLCAPLALPFPEREPQCFTISAYNKELHQGQ